MYTFERRQRFVPASLLSCAAALLLLQPATLEAQDAAVNEAAFQVELRVEMRDYFSGPYGDGEEGTWRAAYVESGEWTFLLDEAGFRAVELWGWQAVDDLEASASPIVVDGCGNQWVREWEDPARVEWESEVFAETVLGDEVVAIWYRPIRSSLMDPGGPLGKGDCYDPDEEEEPVRSDLVFDVADLEGSETESGLPAVRDDGSILLALISWETLASGEEIRRRVRYGDERMGFRARIELRPF